jgi:hypothetical protein
MAAAAVSYAVMPDDDPEPFGDISGAVAVELPIDDDWRKAVTARLKEMGHEQGALGLHIGCSQANISQTLSTKGKRKGQRTSIYAHAISLAVGVDLPDRAVSVLVAETAIAKGASGFATILRGLAEQYGVKLTNPK